MEWCFCAGYREVLSLVCSPKSEAFLFRREQSHGEHFNCKDYGILILSVSKFYGEYQHWEKSNCSFNFYSTNHKYTSRMVQIKETYTRNIRCTSVN